MAKVLIEGQEIELDDEIANDDESLRTALRAAWPDAANATFTRKKAGDVLTVTVQKRAGTKGAGTIVAALLQAPEHLNPALVMQRKLATFQLNQSRSHLEMLALRPEIETAVKDGQVEIKAVKKAREVLLLAPSETGNRVPRGF